MTSPSAAENACIPANLHVEVYEPQAVAAGDTAGTPTLTVVLCHGFGGSARNFRPQARALSKTVRFVLFDMRGHARSEKPRSPEAYRFACLIGDLASVVEAHAPGRVIVGGLSLGSAVALGYALREPERVAGLLLSAHPNGAAPTRRWALDFAENLEENGTEVAGEQFVWGATSRFDAKSRELIKMGFLEHAPWALAAILRHSLAQLEDVESMSERLRELRVPTRVVVGADDGGAIGPCQALARLIPGASLSVIEGAGHVVNLARASAFNEELRQLISLASE